MGHLVIENVSSILITAIFFSQNDVQPLAVLSLAFSCLMTFILLSQATLDTMMSNNVVPTHVERMVIEVHGIDKDKVQKLSNRRLQDRMQRQVGTQFIVNVWWTRTFQKNAEVYMIVGSFADKGPWVKNEIDPKELRKEIAAFVGRVHGADRATYDSDGKRLSVTMRRKPNLDDDADAKSPSSTVIQMSKIFHNVDTAGGEGFPEERDSNDTVVNVGEPDDDEVGSQYRIGH